MKKYSIISVIILMLWVRDLNAQQSISFTRYTFSSIISFVGDSIEFSATLRNTDTTVFQGSIDFGAKRYNQSLSVQIPALNGIVLNPNDTLPFSIKIPITPDIFQSGPNVVIIWPITNRPNNDSIIQTFYIGYKTNIAESYKFDVQTKWLSKSKFILEGDDINSVRQVRILDLMGKEVKRENRENKLLDIQLEFLTQGIYLLEIIGDDNKRRVIRFAYYP